jgi:T-complex protein 1 subunit alpha
MNSKLIGPESDLFAKLVVQAVKGVKLITAIGDVKYPIKSINIVKSHG